MDKTITLFGLTAFILIGVYNFIYSKDHKDSQLSVVNFSRFFLILIIGFLCLALVGFFTINPMNIGELLYIIEGKVGMMHERFGRVSLFFMTVVVYFGIAMLLSKFSMFLYYSLALITLALTGTLLMF
jgi:hypothetical protein